MAKTDISPAQKKFIEQLLRSALISPLIPATFTVPEAAARFGFSEDALRAACDSGALECLRIGDTGHRRIPLVSLIEWASLHRVVA